MSTSGVQRYAIWPDAGSSDEPFKVGNPAIFKSCTYVRTYVRTHVWMEGHLRPDLLGRLCQTVDLKTRYLQRTVNKNYLPDPLLRPKLNCLFILTILEVNW